MARLKDNTKSAIKINHLKSISAKHNIPEVIVGNNGQQYMSFEMNAFNAEYPCHKKVNETYSNTFRAGAENLLNITYRTTTGGAGTGKSHAIKAVFNMIKFTYSQPVCYAASHNISWTSQVGSNRHVGTRARAV